ncbi:hypothetical protein [Sphingobium sp. EM0848]|uniref:hypothetical protein n=1 Tax=Sphingobium sp. EM0848 TaxID=2743473 RepID=UPI00159C02B0|nr:hypothetical protein [Sphingobium sp. EM0848]
MAALCRRMPWAILCVFAFGALLADKALDSNDIIADLNKRIAMGVCKTDHSVEAMICLAAAVINLDESPQASGQAPLFLSRFP